MSPQRRSGRSILMLLVLAACTSNGTATTSTVATTATSTPSSAEGTSTASTVSVEGPGYLLYGSEGIVRVAGGVSVRLVDEPVDWALDDLMGGVIFWEGSKGFWLRAGETEPVELLREGEPFFPAFLGVVDGRVLVFFSGLPSDEELMNDPDVCEYAMIGRDLLNGGERAFVKCLPLEDAGLGIGSFGGGRFVGAPYGQCGGTYTSLWIEFWDVNGQSVEMAANPIPEGESCVPCELDTLISPDGISMAYLHRPDSFHPDSPFYEGPGCGGEENQYSAWWEPSGRIPAAVVVIDLETGQERWRTVVDAGTRLVDFDGRYLVLQATIPSPLYGGTSGRGAEIIDTRDEDPPIRVAEPNHVTLLREPIEPGVAPYLRTVSAGPFWTGILASLDAAATTIDGAVAKGDEFRRLGIEGGVLLSDDYLTLNPGYWVVYSGIYTTREGATARCEELRPLVGSCYPRYVATPHSLDPALDQAAVGRWTELGVRLQPGQYSSIDFTGAAVPLCGLQRDDGTRIGVMDDPSSFLLPEHTQADFLWFGGGTITWRFPNPLPVGAVPRFLRFDLEVSSEAEQARAPHPSEMTVTVNGMEVGRWVIPADPDASYGNPDDPQVARQRNHLDPWRSQFGWLTHWTVDHSGTWQSYDFRLGNSAPERVSGVSLDNLRLARSEVIEVGITVREATVEGFTGFGLNIYGDTWGDYPIDPTVTVGFSPVASGPVAPRLGVMSDLSTLAGRAGDLGVCNHMPGQLFTDDGTTHPAVWVNGELIDLGLPSDRASMGSVSDVNALGQAVGFVKMDGREIAFLWDAGQWTELWVDGAGSTHARVVNNSGQVVVDSSGPDGYLGYLWEAGVFTLIGTNMYATDINERGHVSGYGLAGYGTRAFLWTEKNLTYLGTLGGRDSVGVGLGEDGSVVGWAHTADGDQHAFLWFDGLMTDLGTLGGDESLAHAVNSLGQVVGYSNLVAGEHPHAFFWEEGTMYDLGTLGANWSDATCVDDNGVVTGLSQLADQKGATPFVWRR